MKSKKSSKSKSFASDNTGLTNNPFAALQGATVPDAPAASQSPAPAKTSGHASKPKTQGLGAVGRVIVRRQKKGQGGKTVACVEGLPAMLASELVPRLKRALGCSGRVEDGTMYLGTSDHQGVARWLESQGATNVRLGN